MLQPTFKLEYNELDELLVTQTKINRTPIKYIKRARDLFELCKNTPKWYLQADYEKRENC